jgi:hypothetical protein
MRSRKGNSVTVTKKPKRKPIDLWPLEREYERLLRKIGGGKRDALERAGIWYSAIYKCFGLDGLTAREQGAVMERARREASLTSQIYKLLREGPKKRKAAKA